MWVGVGGLIILTCLHVLMSKILHNRKLRKPTPLCRFSSALHSSPNGVLTVPGPGVSCLCLQQLSAPCSASPSSLRICLRGSPCQEARSFAALTSLCYLAGVACVAAWTVRPLRAGVPSCCPHFPVPVTGAGME